MAFLKSDLVKVAKLARLSLTEEEEMRFLVDLDKIVALVTQLNEVDVEGIAPMSHAKEQALAFREDRAEPTIGRECVSSSMGFEDGLIRVPKIIE